MNVHHLLMHMRKRFLLVASYDKSTNKT